MAAAWLVWCIWIGCSALVFLFLAGVSKSGRQYDDDTDEAIAAMHRAFDEELAFAAWERELEAIVGPYDGSADFEDGR